MSVWKRGIFVAMTVWGGYGDGGLRPRFRGDDGGGGYGGEEAGMAERWGWPCIGMEVGCFRGDDGWVGYGDGAWVPAFAGMTGGGGDDGEVGVA